MIRKHLATFLLFTCLISLEAVAQTNTPKTVQINGKCGGYYEYLPQGYNPSASTTYPVMIFLHGIGETGDGSTGSLAKVLRNGPPLLISQNKFPTSFTVNGQTFKFIVISPQFTSWPSSGDVDAVLEYVKSHYKVDTRRVYVTGLSMGGGVVWNYAADARYASKVAAIAPFCGASGTATNLGKVIADNHTGVWAFHNLNDGSVNVNNTYNWVNYINMWNQSPKAKKTIFNAYGHNCWTAGYDPNYREGGMNVYEYLLQYSTGTATAPPPVANKAPTVNAGTNKVITLPLNLVVLSGSASDPDGTISSYSWSKVSGPASFSLSNWSIAAPTLAGLAQGTYVFRLTVKDNNGATAYDDISVTVNPLIATTPASVNAGGDQQISLPASSVKFSANSPDVAYIAWDKTEGPDSYSISNRNSLTPTVSGLVQGQYAFRIYIKNSKGQAATDTVKVTVKAATATSGASVNAGPDETISLPTNSVKMNATSPDVSYIAWDRTEGPGSHTISNRNTLTPTISNLVEGVYKFRIYIKNSKGEEATDTVVVNVTNTSVAAPAVSTGRVLIDLGPIKTTKDQWGKYWNSMTDASEGTKVSNAVDIQNVKTSISLTVNTRLDGSFAPYDNGVNGDNSIGTVGDYPASAANDNAYTDWTESNGKWTISGLDPGKTYSIKFWGTRSTSSSRVIKIKASTGGGWQKYNAANNRDVNNAAIFSNISGVSSVAFDISSDDGNEWGNISVVDISIGGASSSARTAVSPDLLLSSSNAATGLSLYPNPASSTVLLTVNNDVTGSMKVNIVDLKGTVVKTLALNKAANGSQQVYLSVGDLASGTYIVNVTSGNWSSSTKLVKQ